jgi:hypothetical protein
MADASIAERTDPVECVKGGASSRYHLSVCRKQARGTSKNVRRKSACNACADWGDFAVALVEGTTLDSVGNADYLTK